MCSTGSTIWPAPRPQDHGAPGQGRLLGHRDQACAGRGSRGFPVFTRKEATDVSYICCAQKLLAMTDRIYPQFATHNAHTVAAILEMATDKISIRVPAPARHGRSAARHGAAPSGHPLPHLRAGRRAQGSAGLSGAALLENGANSSFVNQIVDEEVPPRKSPPIRLRRCSPACLRQPIRVSSNRRKLFAPERRSSNGWDLEDPGTVEQLEKGIAAFDASVWEAERGSGKTIAIRSPANAKPVGTIKFCDPNGRRSGADKREIVENPSK